MRRNSAISLSALALVLACAGQPAAAQETEAGARACVSEIDRISESFSLSGANESGRTFTQEPSTRKGATLGPQEHKEINEILQRARTAGEHGDGQACAQGLAQARMALRQVGVGGAQPGAPPRFGPNTRSGGGTSGGATGGGANGGGSGSGGR